jgi:N-acetylglucosamine kinase-like BadF-type ATPase
VTNFTITIIVNSNSHASISKDEILNFTYIVFRCIRKLDIIGILIFRRNIEE